MQEETISIKELVAKGQQAMKSWQPLTQEKVDEAITALGWSLYNAKNARELAQMAVDITELGDVESKYIKNQRKTFGTLRDLLRVATVGIIEDNPAAGMTKYAKPVGVVAAITPSTNPSATPVNKAMMALKGGNAIIIAPSPLAWKVTNATVELMRQALSTIGAPVDLVQIIPTPVTRDATTQLMDIADLVVCTGSQNNVRNAYRSGTPAIGVGAGNVPVIVDDSADITDAAQKIIASKIFDNSTSCSSENCLVIVASVYDKMLAELQRQGGYLANPEEKEKIESVLWQDGKLNRDVVARPSALLANSFGLGDNKNGGGIASETKFFMVEEHGVGSSFPLSGEKLCNVLTIYKAQDFTAAMKKCEEIAEYQGKGHSVGIHTANMDNARLLAEQMETVRVLVNQAHTFGNGGSFSNALPFTLSMGCGTWQGNSISENLNYKCFINITHLVTEVAEDKPSEEEIFGKYLKKYNIQN